MYLYFELRSVMYVLCLEKRIRRTRTVSGGLIVAAL